MKVVHFESGLGNQMLNYAEYLAIRYNYTDTVIEKLIYETLPQNKGISQWNGYELEKVFNLHLPDLKNVIGTDNYDVVKQNLVASEYWNNDWKYAKPIVDSLNSLGFPLSNMCKRGTLGDKEQYSFLGKVLKRFFFGCRIGNFIYRKTARLFEKKLINSNYENMYITSDGDFYCGQTLKFMYKGQNIEKIEKDLRNSFEFTTIDDKNKEFAGYLDSINAVSIHARRGDFLSRNAFCYKFGYFKRAVKYIKKRVKSPIFVFFCDSNSIGWVKDNLKIFGLTRKDNYKFVDWNVEQNSYQDLFLMSKCKHNIITQSSFGWWGSWLNNYSEKITISPDPRINTTIWM